MLVTMSDKELNRINVIQAVVEKRMRRRDAAHQLDLTERQTQRLMNRFREFGAAGLASLRRGQLGNHRLPESLNFDNVFQRPVLKAQIPRRRLHRYGSRCTFAHPR